MRNTHNEDVLAFFAECRRKNPQQYAEVCDKYPIVTPRRLARIRHTEYPIGLLGLQPVPRPPSEVANIYGYPVGEDD